ncbi:2-succinyl-5-enolpyruvyl-6-hydroxy-3-cyclohexene-1-carboxylic-acid synthase [Chloroflexus aggregans]|uniref:2-succinyl-5-enolpyruvyl-6-hydroxy-3-cyclohexene-1-carboxylate synthase n=1 Tax=Chloroflexus aggregans (strain MD-66 / DSM 9485) TaxID=326427 RepID=B8GCW8_CHLAD|nr:2-succinyl-5-enolpyruvyl-6-hydroxy-3-cyclohexene-1-carboxylic-acid synthase [Chloroflexus aggregans]ACL23168.1 2-succinyl-6-hydroxy-2,4-cyclohexadiene-1-carboxylic acid synthase/2-oxoglutarate decarboxylase [Chloroflexus aggregans DSM 9485]
MDSTAHVTTLTRWVATIAQGLAAGGVRDVVVCPGSRSTPLALAVARSPHLRVWMHIDERSAGFFALGLARARSAPVAVLCTSGTAVANLLPAVVEANLARVPLLLLTADRPHELRDNGAPQTIDQVGIFGRNPRWSVDLPTPQDEALPYLRATIGRAIGVARSAPAGPVHLNLPFREPLVPDRALLANLLAEPVAPVSVMPSRRMVSATEIATLATSLAEYRRGLIIAGPDCPPDLGPLLVRLAHRLRFPILADPLSGVRYGSHTDELVLGAYDAFLRDEHFAATYVPEVVLRFGAMPTSKPVLLYLQRHPQVRQIVIDGGAGWREPTSLANEHVPVDEHWFCLALADALASSQREGPTLWLRAWLTAEQAARSVIQDHVLSQTAISEPGLFARLGEWLPAGTTLFVGNSMPVRDCDSFLGPRTAPLTILGNRGANGIDGLVSTGLGLAAGGAAPLVMALGDLSLLHDSNGLLAARFHNINATIILINNDGGGIFSFLPQASETDQFELLFGTPHGIDFAPLAALHNAQYTLATDWSVVHTALTASFAGGLHLIEIRTRRDQNVIDHRRIWPLVSAALSRAGVVERIGA